MTRRSKWVWGGIAAAGLIAVATLAWWSAKLLRENFEPAIRAEAIRYLQDHFQADVQLTRLSVGLPKLSTWKLLRDKGRGTLAVVSGSGLVLSPNGRPDLPPLLKVQNFEFGVDLGILAVTGGDRHVPTITLDGVELNIPPKGQRDHIQLKPKSSEEEEQEKAERAKEAEDSEEGSVVIDSIVMRNSKLTILPRQKDRQPLEFTLQDIRLTNAGPHEAMNYEASLRNPKPDGWILSKGKFGPWNAPDPGDTPLNGAYEFKNANLGVFSTIGGILQSTGTFEGTLSEVSARGEAQVPDFRLKSSGRPMPLWTQFEVLVDGTNGNTVLKPVRARLGTSSFTTSGGIIKREKAGRRSIRLKVNVPKGEISDFLKLATKGDPIMTGDIGLDFFINVPPLDGKVKEKLILDGTFTLSEAQFLRENVAAKVEELSQRGKGKPGQSPQGETLSDMRGTFHLEDQNLRFDELAFRVPGAKVDLNGAYDMAADLLDFHGTLRLDAKVSQTLTGWKRWAAKPLDPFFAKNGAGTFLKIQVTGSSKKPNFGRDSGDDNKDKKKQSEKDRD